MIRLLTGDWAVKTEKFSSKLPMLITETRHELLINTPIIEYWLEFVTFKIIKSISLLTTKRLLKICNKQRIFNSGMLCQLSHCVLYTERRIQNIFPCLIVFPIFQFPKRKHWEYPECIKFIHTILFPCTKADPSTKDLREVRPGDTAKRYIIYWKFRIKLQGLHSPCSRSNYF